MDEMPAWTAEESAAVEQPWTTMLLAPNVRLLVEQHADNQGACHAYVLQVKCPTGIQTLYLHFHQGNVEEATDMHGLRVADAPWFRLRSLAYGTVGGPSWDLDELLPCFGG